MEVEVEGVEAEYEGGEGRGESDRGTVEEAAVSCGRLCMEEESRRRRRMKNGNLCGGESSVRVERSHCQWTRPLLSQPHAAERSIGR